MTLLRDLYVEVGDILGSGGTAYAIITAGDPLQENAAHTTHTTKGSGAGDGLVFTYGPGTRNDFDVPTAYARNRRRQSSLKLNKTDEESDSPDADFWLMISGGVDAPASLGAWITLFSVTGTQAILGKENEWRWAVVGSDLQFLAVDGAAFPSRDSDGSALIIAEPNFLAMTYDGRGGADAMDGVTLYKNRGVLASTATNSGAYVDMADQATVQEWGKAAGTDFFGGLIQGGEIGAFKTNQELTGAQLANIYDIGIAAQRPDRSRLLAGVL